MALQTGILVAFTQIIPEHQVQVFGLLKVRVKVREFLVVMRRPLSSVLSAPADGVRDIVHGAMPLGLPIALDQYPVGLACIVHLPPLLQEE